MTNRQMLFMCVAASVFAVTLAWAALVPAAMSFGTFAWTLAAIVTASGGTLAAARAGRAPRTIAQVLHEAEHAGARRR
jgi:hypothetical protein